MSRRKTEAELKEHLMASLTAHAMGEVDNEAFARKRVGAVLARYHQEVGARAPQAIEVLQKDFDAFLDAPTDSARRRIVARLAGQAMDNIDSVAPKEVKPPKAATKMPPQEYPNTRYENRRPNNPMANIPTGVPSLGMLLFVLAYILFMSFVVFGWKDLFR